jgi:hypothetical protein
MCHAVLTVHCPPAMDSRSSPGSSGITARSGTRTNSPYPPQQPVPKIVRFGQRSGRQFWHRSHVSQLYCSSAVTRSPVPADVTWSPTSVTVPVNSAPRTHGSVKSHRDVPRQESRSE